MDRCPAHGVKPCQSEQIFVTVSLRTIFTPGQGVRSGKHPVSCRWVKCKTVLRQWQYYSLVLSHLCIYSLICTLCHFLWYHTNKNETYCSYLFFSYEHDSRKHHAQMSPVPQCDLVHDSCFIVIYSSPFFKFIFYQPWHLCDNITMTS